MSSQKGFTLIELLVVISIIGLLSSIVLASLGSARDKGADAAVKQQLTQMRVAAQLIYEETGSYDTVCSASSDSGRLYRAAAAQGTRTPAQSYCASSSIGTGLCTTVLIATQCSIGATGYDMTNKWAAIVQLKGKPGSWFCVDYTGAAKETTSRSIDLGTPPIHIC